MDFALPCGKMPGRFGRPAPLTKRRSNAIMMDVNKNHTKTRKRRVGFWHCLNQRAPMVETGGEQEAEHGLRVAPARGGCPKPTPGTPVTASGCKQRRCRSRQGPRREAAPGKKQGGTAKNLRPWLQGSQPGAFFFGRGRQSLPSGEKPNPRGRKRNRRKRPARKSSHLPNHLQ